MNPLLLLTPWAVGPAPSAHSIEPGWTVGAEASALVGERPLGGGSALVGAAHGRLDGRLALQAGAGWDLCPDCEARALTGEIRLTAIRHDAFNLVPWVSGAATTGTADGLFGLAAEGGSQRIRVDASWPLQSSWFLLTTLRIVPEHGVSVAWTEHHRTRLAVVGLEPGFALQHRVRAGDWQVEPTLRFGEEGLGGQLAVAWAPGRAKR